VSVSVPVVVVVVDDADCLDPGLAVTLIRGLAGRCDGQVLVVAAAAPGSGLVRALTSDAGYELAGRVHRVEADPAMGYAARAGLAAELLPELLAAGAKIGEREVCLDLLAIATETGLLAPRTTVLADKNLAGRQTETQITALGIRLLQPDRRDEPARHGNLSGFRQWIESVYDSLKGQLGLERHGGRTPHGVFTRVAQRLLALAACIWRNWATGAVGKRSLTAYDH
jgi:hypothetical protein